MKTGEYRINRGKICIVSGCENMAKVKGLCIRCYRKKENKEKYGKKIIDVFTVDENLFFKDLVKD